MFSSALMLWLVPEAALDVLLGSLIPCDSMSTILGASHIQRTDLLTSFSCDSNAVMFMLPTVNEGLFSGVCLLPAGIKREPYSSW